METPPLFREFAVTVRRSAETRAFEARFTADGVDLIDRYWSRSIGLAPRGILAQSS